MNSFIEFKPSGSNRRLPDRCIMLNERTIYLGKTDTAYPFYKIEFDREQKAIRFTEGNDSNGFKIISNRNGIKHLNAYSFLKHKYIPLGQYKLIDFLTYKFEELDRRKPYTRLAQQDTPRPLAKTKSSKIATSDPKRKANT